MSQQSDRVAEEVRAILVDVDDVIANGKELFLKFTAGCTVFHVIAQEKPLPPQPIPTEWGSWIFLH